HRPPPRPAPPDRVGSVGTRFGRYAVRSVRGSVGTRFGRLRSGRLRFGRSAVRVSPTRAGDCRRSRGGVRSPHGDTRAGGARRRPGRHAVRLPAMAYLDHAATTPMLPEAAEAVAAALLDTGNPSSLHAAGRKARRAVEESRERVAAAIGARPYEVVFTGG